MKKNLSEDIRILGLDPGTATTGWGVIDVKDKAPKLESFGCIETHKSKNSVERLKELAEDLEKLIDKFQPDEIAVEELFYFKNAKTVIGVAQARGVLLLVAGRSGRQVSEYTPLQVKQAVTGYGRAEKTQVQLMVKSILKLNEIPRPDDAADAIAVAMCHQQSRNFPT